MLRLGLQFKVLAAKGDDLRSHFLAAHSRHAIGLQPRASDNELREILAGFARHQNAAILVLHSRDARVADDAAAGLGVSSSAHFRPLAWPRSRMRWSAGRSSSVTATITYPQMA